MIVDVIELGMFEQAVGPFRGKEGLKIGHQALKSLVVEALAAFDVLSAVQAVVQHIVPLHCELFAWWMLLAGGELLRDAEHLLEPPHVLLWGCQEVLHNAMVSSRLHVDVLEVPGRFAVGDGANKAMESGKNSS